jgi:hypothetical protein
LARARESAPPRQNDARFAHSFVGAERNGRGDGAHRKVHRVTLFEFQIGRVRANFDAGTTTSVIRSSFCKTFSRRRLPSAGSVKEFVEWNRALAITTL